MPITPEESYKSALDAVFGQIDRCLRAGKYTVALREDIILRFGRAVRSAYHDKGWAVSIEAASISFLPIFEPELIGHQKDEQHVDGGAGPCENRTYSEILPMYPALTPVSPIKARWLDFALFLRLDWLRTKIHFVQFVTGVCAKALRLRDEIIATLPGGHKKKEGD